MPFKRVVVTGLGALTPIGNDVTSFWNNLSAGVSGAGPITKFNAEKFRTRFACEVKGLDITQFIPRQEARKMDPFAQYAVVVADEAIRDSGLNLEEIDLDKAGVIWGSGIGGLKTFQDEVSTFATGDGSPRYNPFFIPKMIADSASGLLSIRYGFRGVNYVTVSACASSGNAITDAFNFIRLGRMKLAITGGSEAAITEAGIGGFNALRALSERNDSPETASRPFDKDRDGFVLGEGAGALILEEYEHAKARGAKIYAELIGCGMSSDAYHITASHPDGLGAVKAMEDALDDAGLKAEEVDYINVHGTSTPVGDPSEAKAIEQVFGEHAYVLNISSTKSMTGHLLGAAGAIEAIASIMAIQNDLVPPTINHFTDDEAFNPKLNFTFNQAQTRPVKVALSNTFGFGGHNSTIVFRRLED
ncbi:beta-ketoacyl-ACP synthase II [Tellurirhabdus rosea]|uniref:beta-ketoacyl-ACP synthase II n=1 Tax=Tellurirhabdus rosea TaxID=2674997 RepID=UPI00225090CD|nr:beta-ketoacyl-ACP synthase II [Tellurirhabdus rosea]